MNQNKILVELHNAGLHRQGRWPVRGVGFCVEKGEIVTLIGPNGSGKSTTVKMALGLEQPDEGYVTRRKGLRIGYVPQKFSLDWALPLTVGRLMALTAKRDKKTISAALQRTGAGHLLDEAVQNLSGGEFQRVLLARAISAKPDLLVLDEAVQGVDFNGQIALYTLIAEIRDELGCGILLISHDLHLVMAATDKVVCLNGHVCCSGAPQMVAESAEYRTLFGEKAAGALAIYRHDHDHVHLEDGRVRHHDGSISDSCHPNSLSGDSHHHEGGHVG